MIPRTDAQALAEQHKGYPGNHTQALKRCKDDAWTSIVLGPQHEYLSFLTIFDDGHVERQFEREHRERPWYYAGEARG